MGAHDGGDLCHNGPVTFCTAGGCEGACSTCGVGLFDQQGKVGLSICAESSGYAYTVPLVPCSSGCGAERCCGLVFDPDRLSCVSREVCDQAKLYGEALVTYTDGTPYTQSVIPPIGKDHCADITSWPTCSVDCPCAKDDRCTGLSPTHPVGLCMPAVDDTPNVCGKDGKCGPGELCFVFATPGEPYLAHSLYIGRCLPEPACTDLAAKLPGGAACLDGLLQIVAGSLTATSP